MTTAADSVPDLEIEIGPHSGLVVVDVQNDFADPAGRLYVPEGEKIIPAVNRLVTSASDAGAAVVYTQDWHPAHTPHFDTGGGRWPPHSWGAQLHPDLQITGLSSTKASAPPTATPPSRSET